MKTIQIEAKSIKPGDRVLAESGEPVRIKEVGKGMPVGTIELRWQEGVELKWMALKPTSLVERAV